ncbi:MAG: 50S ribosomal protein L21e [Methanomassiliicoccales archaeon]|nr:MAG: 50S ribosomal protein L21e [Methanomassiliicoccales archaeon]
MVRRSKGTRSKTRQLMRKRPRQRGSPSATRVFQTFEEGEKASIVIDPSVHKGQPHRRFFGLTGTIVGKQGSAYLVEVRTGNKKKTLIVGPEHLKKQAA